MYDEQKPHEHEIAPDLAALEQQLRGITPTAPRIDRDRLMFAAGHAAADAASLVPGRDGRAMYDYAGRSLYIAGPSWAARRFWPAATLTMTAATLLLATMLVWQNRSQFASQQAPLAPAIVATNSNVSDIDVDRPAQVASRSQWMLNSSANSGYLGVRYVALTRGIGDLPYELPSSGNDKESPPNNRAEPATSRGLLNELLPATHPSNSSSS